MIVGQLALEIVALLWALRSRARVLAVVLAYALADELVVGVLHWRVFTAEKHPVQAAMVAIGYWPARSLYHLETAIVLGWLAVLAGASWVLVFVQQKAEKIQADIGLRGRSNVPRYVLGLWALAVVVLALAFPLPRGWTAPTLHAIDGLFVGVAVVAFGVGFRRRVLRGTELAALGCLVAVELVVATCGAWGHDVFRDWETLARVPHSIGLIAAIGVLAYQGRQ